MGWRQQRGPGKWSALQAGPLDGERKLGTRAATMSTIEYIHYRGIMVPPVAHSEESLEYAQKFSVEDTDVFAVTYPKSGSN